MLWLNKVFWICKVISSIYWYRKTTDDASDAVRIEDLTGHVKV